MKTYTPIRSSGEGNYYLAKMSARDFKKICSQRKIIMPRPCTCNNVIRAMHPEWENVKSSVHFAPWEVPGRMTKEMVDRFPKYLRRGGEYGHEGRWQPLRTRISGLQLK